MYLTMHENNFFFFTTVYRSCSDFYQLKSKIPIFSPIFFFFNYLRTVLTIFSLFLNCRPKTMTQGDRLNQIKAKKQAASCGNVPVEKLKGHVRVKSVPSRTLVNNSNNNSGSGSAATTSAALSPSRPLTRMQAEAVAAASVKNQVCLILSNNELLHSEELSNGVARTIKNPPNLAVKEKRTFRVSAL